MNDEGKPDLDVLYYQEKIIATITNCKNVKLLQYIEKFNRLLIEKSKNNKE